MAIYTKTGDKGKTGTFGGKRVSKSSKLISAIGAVDELNSFLGILGAEVEGCKATGAKNSLYHCNVTMVQTEKKILDIQDIQRDLFTINSILAGSKLRFNKSKTNKLEKEIDKWEGELPVQKNFIYYGGSQTASLIFYARALCRKAERELVTMHDSSFMIPDSIMVYMNRLSDYLFMLARSVNHEAKVKEQMWIGNKEK